MILRINNILNILIVIGFMFLIFAGYKKYYASNEEMPENETIVTKSMLMDAVDVSELSSAQFTYNGIAKTYKDKKKKKGVINIKYNAIVKASIEMSEVEFEVDEDEKLVTITLPDLSLVATVTNDEPLSFIPDSTDMDLADALKICKNDVEKEVGESSELRETAEENMRAIIEGLTYPLLNSQGYELEWKKRD